MLGMMWQFSVEPPMDASSDTALRSLVNQRYREKLKVFVNNSAGRAAFNHSGGTGRSQIARAGSTKGSDRVVTTRQGCRAPEFQCGRAGKATSVIAACLRRAAFCGSPASPMLPCGSPGGGASVVAQSVAQSPPKLPKLASQCRLRAYLTY
jgi:hypothetical protein